MVRFSSKMRNVQFFKPERYKDYVTITELSRLVNRDISWLRRLERLNRIPQAHRVKAGELSVRLWSPAQVDEIKEVLSKIKRGRPPGA